MRTDSAMADARGLRLIGVFFVGIAVLVGIVALLLVTEHVTGRRSFDGVTATGTIQPR
jgi:hypothetical protein